VGISREYREFVADAFSAFGEVQIRPMFGGAGIYRDGLMFGLISSQEGVYLKADDASRVRFEAEGLEQFAPEMPGRPAIAMLYWRVPDRLLEDGDELAEWARAAFGVAFRTRKPKKAARATPAKPARP
jgi:DNA transformation protein